MAINGIKKRWLVNFLSWMVLILSLLSLCFSFLIREYYYNNTEKNIQNRSDTFLAMLREHADGSKMDFNRYSQKYIENCIDNEFVSIVVFDTSGNIVGFTHYTNEIRQDASKFHTLKINNDIKQKWIGRTHSGKKVMIITNTIYDNFGNHIGYIRYVASLDALSSIITLAVSCVFLLGVIIAIFVVVTNLLFMKSILDPLYEVGAIAKRIAQGDFNSRIVKRYNDEIGGLCDTINYMAEELGTNEKLKNDFISSVSHEIRTPLTAIKGWAETIQMDGVKDNETTQRGMKIIINEAERLSGVVEELLDFSNMQNKRMILTVCKMDILAELDEAVYMFNERVKSEGKTIIYNCPDSISPLYGDPNRIRQVFINIIDNAIKYTDENGEIIVSICEGASYIKVMVSDNGCGISAKHLPKVKEKFYKSNQTKRGSGIGLAIADEIISLHSGTLDVQSKDGVGTTVSIMIPFNGFDNVSKD